MNWEDTELECYVRLNLWKVIGRKRATALFQNYVQARNSAFKLIENIIIAEPDLSDHGPRHIEDVLNNAWGLTQEQDICPLNLFILTISIVYHDIGNILGRKNHNKNIGEFFKKTFPDDFDEKSVIKSMVLKVAKAHTGEGNDGTKNTLQDLEGNLPHLYSKTIDLQNIAAILRLADEMAEGPHRTSKYRVETGMFKNGDSQIYHAYARCCVPAFANRTASRLVLNFNIPYEEIDGVICFTESKTPLKELLKMIYQRIIKFDQERKYCKYYSNILADFKHTSISIEFHLNDTDETNISLTPLILSDLEIPGKSNKSIEDIDNDYKISSIISKLTQDSNNGSE